MNSLKIEVIEESTKKFYEKKYNYEGDSGFDLYCIQDVAVPANSISFKIPLGIKCQLNHVTDEKSKNIGFMLLPRSSTGSKTPLRLSNSIGIIDRSYRGQLMAIVDNQSDVPYEITSGDRLFQVVPFDGEGIGEVVLGEVDSTERGSGGLGSTGK